MVFHTRSNVIKLQTYSEKITGDVVEYFKTLKHIAKANKWNKDEKLIIIPLYLRDQAKKLFNIIEIKTSISTGEMLKTLLSIITRKLKFKYLKKIYIKELKK